MSVRGVYRFSSLVKLNKKAKNCAVFCFAGKRKIFFIYLWSDYLGKKKKKLCYSVVRERARGGCGFSSLMKQKIKGENCAVFCFAGQRIFFYIFMMWLHGKNLKNGPLITTNVSHRVASGWGRIVGRRRRVGSGGRILTAGSEGVGRAYPHNMHRMIEML